MPRIDEPVSSAILEREKEKKKNKTQAVTLFYSAAKQRHPLPTAVGDRGDHVFAA